MGFNSGLKGLITRYKSYCDRIKPRTHDETIYGLSLTPI
jgi:hypothetical protein